MTRWLHANIGARTDNAPRIDIDLIDVAGEFAKDTAPPLTTEIVRTPRGGLHISLATDAPTESSALYAEDGRKLGGAGGPGSVH